MMNKLFMIVVSVCCLLMTACGTENDETPQGFRIVDTDVDLVAGGGTVEVVLQAAGELTAVSGADWCRVIEVTNEKITLLARANYEYVSRATQVTVSDGSNEQKIVVTQAGNIFAPDTDQQVLRLGNAPSQTVVRVNSSFDFKVSIQKGVDWVEVPTASKEEGFLLVLKENKTGNPRACQLMVSTNEGRKFFYYVYQYEASDLLGAWRDSQIYVKWDTKKIDKAYRLSATEVTKDAEGDGYTINMSLVGTPVAPYLKDPSKATISLQATYEDGAFVVPIGAAQKDFVLTQEVDGTANNAMNRTADDTALEEDVVLQTLYGFSVAASSNIYAKGNFGFAPVLYQDGSIGMSYQDVAGAPESGCYLAIALFDGQQFSTAALKDYILSLTLRSLNSWKLATYESTGYNVSGIDV